MEEVGAQVASPVFMGHQSFTGRFCEPHSMPKKRSLPAFVQQQHKHSGSWNPKQWEWDSARFVAKPRESAEAPPVEVEQHDATREEHSLNSSISGHAGEGFDDLRLKLGDGSKGETGSSLNSAEEPVSRPNKRVRSGSPGSASYPMCQVDTCKEDLSHAKDYHRRHKVCEFHSKSTKALVAKQMQRFCQQCSRFHPLTEFDEGKRSCRRRLAGHNRRRRKTQPEDATSRLVIPGNQESTGSNDLDIVNLFAVLAHAQGNAEDKGTNVLSMPDKDQLLQILTKINTLPLPLPLPENLVAKLPVFGNRGKSIPNQVPSENYVPVNGNTYPSTMDLLAVLSGNPAVRSPNKLESPQDRSCLGSDSEKTNSACSDQATCLNLNSGPALEFPFTGGEGSSSSEQSPPDNSECHAEERHQNLPLQLFSSSPEDDCPPKLTAIQMYFSSDSSNPSEARSPSYSPPVAQKLFPLQTSREALKPMNLCCSVDGDTNSIAIRDTDCNTSLQLFSGSSRGTDTGLPQNRQYQAG